MLEGQNPKDEKPASILYHLHTLWLFTFSDFKTILFPSTAFAILTYLSGPTLTTSLPQSSRVITRLPLCLLWTWSTLLLVDIANQRHSHSVLEDRLNKPWRPLASGRLTSLQARRLLLFAIPSVLAIALILFPQGLIITVIAIIGSYMYNDLGAADESFLMRNIMNACAITCFGAGAALVLCGEEATLNEAAYRWLAVIFSIVTTTMQVQDLADQEGDRARGRVTVPLWLGNATARYSVAVLVTAWSVICPFYWQLDPWGYAMPMIVGLTVAGRSISMRSVNADQGTWKAWNVWMVTLYILPVWQDGIKALQEATIAGLAFVKSV